LIVLSVPLVPKPNEKLSQMFKVPRGSDQFFLEAHIKLRPIDFATDGIFLAGTGHYPKFTSESIYQGSGAAVRVMALLAPGYLLSEGAIAEIDQDACRGCGRCEEICPYKAIELEVKAIELETETIKTVKAYVNPGVCKGCGSCLVTCPVTAITVKHFPDKTIEAQVESILFKTDQLDIQQTP
jgi:heterodisulfide reductase subunit A